MSRPPHCVASAFHDSVWALRYVKMAIQTPTMAPVTKIAAFRTMEQMGSPFSGQLSHYLRRRPSARTVVANAGSSYTWPVSYNRWRPIVDMVYSRADVVYAMNIDRRALTPSQSRRTFWLPVGLAVHSGVPPHLASGQFWTEAVRRQTRINEIARRPFVKTRRMLVTWRDSTHQSRPEMREQALASGNADCFVGEQDEYWSMMHRHLFVPCPRGTGWDTHRMWEALVLGCIPLVEQESILRADIEAAGLPVEFVSTYNLSQDDLEAIAAKHTPLTPDDPRLTWQYYINPETRVCGAH